MNVANEMNEKAACSGFPDLMSRARHGKIARLPRHLREEINRRLDENQFGVKILAWINAQPEARQVFDNQFDAKPISLQNLSNWRREGFVEWLRYQFAAEQVDRQVAASRGKSLQEAVIDPLERVLAVQCLATYEQATESADSLTKFQYLCQGMREINAMRRHEHGKAWQALKERKESYEFKRFSRTQSHLNRSPARSTQSPLTSVESLNRGIVEPSPKSEPYRFNAFNPFNDSTPTQANPGKSEHIKVDQGGKKFQVPGARCLVRLAPIWSPRQSRRFSALKAWRVSSQIRANPTISR